MRFEARRMRNRADRPGLAVRERTHEHVVIALIVTVPPNPYGAGRIRCKGGVPGVGRRFADLDFRSPNAVMKRLGVDGGVPVSKGLPGQPKISPAGGGRVLAEIRSVRGGQALDRAPCLPGLAPLVQIPVAVDLRRPDDVQRAPAVISSRWP